jgi:type I restriction enzyme S subunit
MSDLYELPIGWEWKTLNDIFTIERGGSPRPIKEYITEEDDGINWIKIGDTVKGEKYIESTEQKIKPSGLKHTRLVNEGDFIMSNSMSFGRPYIVKTKGAIHDGWLLMREKVDYIDKDFFYYLLSSNYMYQQFTEKASGTTVKNLNIPLVKTTDIPLPPLSEQQRIVSKLDLLFEKIDKSITLHQKNMDEANVFMGSVLNDVFGELEEKYEVLEVGKITNCIVPQRNKPKQFIGDIEWITTDDLILFSRISESSKGLGLRREEIKESQSKIIPKESVIMSCVGYLGMVSIADVEMVVNQQLHTFQCNELLNNKYLMYALYVKRDYMYSIANITTVAYMNKSKCNSIPLPLPPLHIQEKVVKYLDEISQKIEKVKSVQKVKMDSLKALKASILDRAFKGAI